MTNLWLLITSILACIDSVVLCFGSVVVIGGVTWSDILITRPWGFDDVMSIDTGDVIGSGFDFVLLHCLCLVMAEVATPPDLQVHNVII